MFKLQIKKKWFTLAEVLIVCTVFAVMVVWMILAINRAFVFMDNIKLQVIATNLAREWVEMMYNIRDTNWRKFSGERDKYWLAMQEAGSDESCRFGRTVTWFFYIHQIKDDGSFDPIGPRCPISLESGFDHYYNDVNAYFEKNGGGLGYIDLYLNKQYLYYSWGQMMTGKVQDLLWDDVEFHRVWRVYGVYKKNVDGSLELCDNINCLQDSDPKEMRFCVKVFYRNGHWKHATELCSIMTNFMK